MGLLPIEGGIDLAAAYAARDIFIEKIDHYEKLAEISSHYRRGYSLDEISEYLGLNRSCLSHLFVQNMNFPKQHCFD